jgi:hypothetical protein
MTALPSLLSYGGEALYRMPSAETGDFLGHASSPLSRRERVRVRGLKAQRLMPKEVL